MNYPAPDRSNQRLNFGKTAEDDTLDIGWAEGTLSDGRPYRAECWCQDQVTMLTIFFSTLGLERATDADLEQLLVREKLVSFKVGNRFVRGARFVDPSSHELWSVNVVVGDDEDTFIADSVPLNVYARRVEPPPAPGSAQERPL